MVFAPRGGGKTALKRMIEISSLSEPFMCITYNQFNVASQKLSDIDLDYHLENIARLLLVAIISSAADRGVEKLSADDRHILYLMTKEYLSAIDTTDLKNAIASVQNLSDKAKEWWNNFTGPIGLVLNALLTKIGFGTAEVEKFKKAGGKLGNRVDQISTPGSMARSLGYACIYVLID